MDAEFFVEDNDSSKLIREAIQNSLDARLPHTKDIPVRFRIQLIRNQKIDSQNKYTSGLEGHLQQTSPLTHHLVREKMDYLVIEDFNTKGLQGDILQYDDPESGNDNDFLFLEKPRTLQKK